MITIVTTSIIEKITIDLLCLIILLLCPSTFLRLNLLSFSVRPSYYQCH